MAHLRLGKQRQRSHPYGRNVASLLQRRERTGISPDFSRYAFFSLKKDADSFIASHQGEMNDLNPLQQLFTEEALTNSEARDWVKEHWDIWKTLDEYQMREYLDSSKNPRLFSFINQNLKEWSSLKPFQICGLQAGFQSKNQRFKNFIQGEKHLDEWKGYSKEKVRDKVFEGYLPDFPHATEEQKEFTLNVLAYDTSGSLGQFIGQNPEKWFQLAPRQMFALGAAYERMPPFMHRLLHEDFEAFKKISPAQITELSHFSSLHSPQHIDFLEDNLSKLTPLEVTQLRYMRAGLQSGNNAFLESLKNNFKDWKDKKEDDFLNGVFLTCFPEAIENFKDNINLKLKISGTLDALANDTSGQLGKFIQNNQEQWFLLSSEAMRQTAEAYHLCHPHLREAIEHHFQGWGEMSSRQKQETIGGIRLNNPVISETILNNFEAWMTLDAEQMSCTKIILERPDSPLALSIMDDFEDWAQCSSQEMEAKRREEREMLLVI